MDVKLTPQIAPTPASAPPQTQGASGTELAAKQGYMAAGIAGGTQLEPFAELATAWRDAIASAESGGRSYFNPV